MNWFENIKKWYKLGLWTDVQVQMAVSYEKITQEQADEIIANK